MDTSGITLEVTSKVTSISPTSGSIYGGTLLTITGTNFGSVATDNPVQISYNGALGSTDCFVKTISETQITCRVANSYSAIKSAGSTGKVIVF